MGSLHEVEEAGAALAAKVGRAISAGAVPPAAGTRAQVAEGDTEERPAPPPEEVKLAQLGDGGSGYGGGRGGGGGGGRVGGG